MKGLKQKFNNLSKKHKVQIIVASVMTIMLFIAVPVVAWFVNYKRIESMIKINAPTVLTIGAGGEDAAEMIDLGNINVEEKVGNARVLEGDYVFSVQGKYLSSYDIQITRTTNIPFTYEIYRVSTVTGVSGDSTLSKGWGTTNSEIKDALASGTYNSTKYNIAEYVAYDGTSYYYPYVTTEVTDTESDDYLAVGKISGTYLNGKSDPNALVDGNTTIGDGSKTLGDGTYHTHNYDSYTNVNKYVEPLYWQALDLPINTAGRLDTGNFADYYVLKITWTANFSNTKETDMIYITAKRH